MEIWELALLLVAITYMVINTISMLVIVKMMAKYDSVLTKCINYINKMLDKAEKELEENDL